MTKDYDTIYLRQIRKFAPLSENEEKLLYRKLKAGNRKARNRIIKTHLPLVIKIAHRYWRPGTGIEFMELVEEGELGLLDAVNKFKPCKGVKLSTYANWWIEKYIQHAIVERLTFLNVPEKVYYDLRKLLHATDEYLQKGIHAISAETIAKKLGYSLEKTSQLLLSANAIRMPVSLDKTINEDEKTTVGDMLFPQENISFDERIDKIEQEIAEDKIRRYLDLLDKKEAQVIKWRFGFLGEGKYTLRKIARKLKLSPNTIKRIEAQGLRHLKLLFQGEKE